MRLRFPRYLSLQEEYEECVHFGNKRGHFRRDPTKQADINRRNRRRNQTYISAKNVGRRVLSGWNGHATEQTVHV
ncbi:hypothetical protein INT45_009084 [Circinella minor]|uniref:Uncharacterized protein n=1 Tax=Circinella minor TaxID=1195481 RepID=A0A8H7RV22_9FUNG|nr:hypothetical protein INT45_009084 [Circinella minor]